MGDSKLDRWENRRSFRFSRSIKYVINHCVAVRLIWHPCLTLTCRELGRDIAIKNRCCQWRRRSFESEGDNWKVDQQSPKGRSLRPEGPKAGVWFLEKGQPAHRHQLGDLGERCKPPSGVRDGAPAAEWFLLYFRCSNWLLLYI